MTQDLPPTGDSVNIRSPQSEAKAQAVASQGQTVIVNTTPPESRSKFPVWVIPVVIALVGVTAVVAFLAGNQLGRGNAPAAGSVTPQVLDRVVRETVLAEKQVTAEVTRLATVIVEREVTRVVEKPVEKRVTVLVPQTVVVEKVVAPSATPLPPTPAVTLPFEDNFDNGARPEWEQVSGSWNMVEGAFAPDPGGLAIAVVGDQSWTNYAVEVDVIYYDSNWPSVDVIFRAQGRSYMKVVTNCCGTEMYVVTSGKEKRVGQGGPGGLGVGARVGQVRLRVEAVDDVFTVFSNDNQIMRVQDRTLSSGKVGVSVANDGYDWRRFDNFKVSPLP